MGLRLSPPSFRSLFVEVFAKGDALISTATAFLACTHEGGEQFLVTNRHVVTGRHQDTLKLLDTGSLEPETLVVWHNSSAALGHHVKVRVPLYGADESPLWFEHLIDGPRKDLVVLPAPAQQGVARYPYVVESNSHLKVEPAQMVSVVGFPFAERTAEAFAVWATGFIASEPDFDHGEMPLFLIDCRSRKGQSGSPVILHHGVHDKDANTIGFKRGESDLLGVYSGRVNEDSDLGKVWKAWALAELLGTASGGHPNGRREFASLD